MPRTLLLVEDDPDDVLLVQRACREAGVRHPVQVVGPHLARLKPNEQRMPAATEYHPSHSLPIA